MKEFALGLTVLLGDDNPSIILAAIRFRKLRRRWEDEVKLDLKEM
jgi:hypothetical protein